RVFHVTGVQTCALPISVPRGLEALDAAAGREDRRVEEAAVEHDRVDVERRDLGAEEVRAARGAARRAGPRDTHDVADVARIDAEIGRAAGRQTGVPERR